MNVAISLNRQAERRHQLTRIRVEGFDRELGIGVRRPVRGAETERCPCSLEGILVYPINLGYRYVSPNGGNYAPAVISRASTVHVVHDVSVEPLSHKVGAPAFTSLRRRLIVASMVTAAMGEDDRIFECLIVGKLIVHVRLIDFVRTAFKRGYAGTSGRLFASIIVRRLDLLSVDVEVALVPDEERRFALCPQVTGVGTDQDGQCCCAQAQPPQSPCCGSSHYRLPSCGCSHYCLPYRSSTHCGWLNRNRSITHSQILDVPMNVTEHSKAATAEHFKTGHCGVSGREYGAALQPLQ